MNRETRQSWASLPGISRVALLVVAVVVLAGAMKVAAVAVLPIVASLLLCALFWPMRTWLSRRMPAWLAAAACSFVIFLALLLVAGWAWYASGSAARQFNASEEKYVEQYRTLRAWLTDRGVPESSVPEVNGQGELELATPEGSRTGGLSPEVRNRAVRVVAGGLQSAAGALAALLLTIFLAYLALLEGERWARWTSERLHAEGAAVLRDIVGEWSAQTRRYFLGKTISGVISGAATWLWLMVMGVPMALTWGVFTLFMNFIPNIGALISGLPPTIIAVVELGWTKGLIVAAGLLAIETLVGNLVDPFVQGNMLKLSVFVTLASLVFWGWLWGAAGAVMAPVLTAGIVTAVARVHAAGGPARAP